MAFTYTWNSSFEAVPADGDNARDGALKIRDLKKAISERMVQDHSWDVSSPNAKDGKHKQVSFLQQSSDPAAVADEIP